MPCRYARQSLPQGRILMAASFRMRVHWYIILFLNVFLFPDFNERNVGLSEVSLLELISEDIRAYSQICTCPFYMPPTTKTLSQWQNFSPPAVVCYHECEISMLPQYDTYLRRFRGLSGVQNTLQQVSSKAGNFSSKFTHQSLGASREAEILCLYRAWRNGGDTATR